MWSLKRLILTASFQASVYIASLPRPFMEKWPGYEASVYIFEYGTLSPYRPGLPCFPLQEVCIIVNANERVKTGRHWREASSSYTP